MLAGLLLLVGLLLPAAAPPVLPTDLMLLAETWLTALLPLVDAAAGLGLLAVPVLPEEQTSPVEVAAPGTHWKYQSFCTWQWNPETQDVSPVQPIPPHRP